MNNNLPNNPNIEVIKAKETGLFTNYVFKAIPLAFDESMSYYETLCGLLSYLKDTVIPTVNNNANAVVELQNLYNQLHDYVENYFNNLDVQNEINNKLDVMAIDGTLERIINQEIFNELNNNVNELINKSDYFNIEPKQLFIQDIGNYSMQGGCVDDNNVLYLYRSKGTNTGDLLKYNLISNTYIGIIQNVKLYHGNGLTYKNGKIYATAFSKVNEGFTTLICIYDIATNTVQEINPFGNNFIKSVGVCNYDDDNLLVALQSDTSTKIKTLKFAKLNINTYNYELINCDFGNLSLNTNSLIAEIEKKDNKIYVQTSEPNQIFEFDLINNQMKINKIYNIPTLDELGLFIGESETLSFMPSNYFGKYTAIYSTQQYDTVSLNNVTLKTYLINFETNLSNVESQFRETIYQNQSSNIYVNASSNSMLEYGTQIHPFKTLNRAISSLNRDNTRNTMSIVIDDNSTYDLSAQYNKLIKITNTNGKTPTIIGLDTLNNCDVDIRSINTNSKIKLDGVFAPQNSKIFCQLCSFINSNIILNNNDYATFYQCTIDSTNAQYDNSISINKSIANLQFDAITPKGNGKAVYVSTSGVVYMNYYTSAQPRTAQSGSFVFTTE